MAAYGILGGFHRCLMPMELEPQVALRGWVGHWEEECRFEGDASLSLTPQHTWEMNVCWTWLQLRYMLMAGDPHRSVLYYHCHNINMYPSGG